MFIRLTQVGQQQRPIIVNTDNIVSLEPGGANMAGTLIYSTASENHSSILVTESLDQVMAVVDGKAIPIS